MSDAPNDPWLDVLDHAKVRLRSAGVRPWVARKGKAVRRVKYMLGPLPLAERLAPLGELFVVWPKAPGLVPHRLFNPVSPRLFPQVGFCWLGAAFLDTASFPPSYGIPPDMTAALPDTVWLDGAPRTLTEWWGIARPLLYHPGGRCFALRIDDREHVRLVESDVTMARWRSVEDDLDAAVAAAFAAVGAP